MEDSSIIPIEFKHMEGAHLDIHDLDFTDQIATHSLTNWIWCFLKTLSHVLLAETTECQHCGL